MRAMALSSRLGASGRRALSSQSSNLPIPFLSEEGHELKRKGSKAHCLTGLSQNLLKELQNNKRPYLRLNVGGTSYKLLMETILKRGETGLLFTFVNIGHEDRLKICHDYFESTNQYFFERPAELFDYIYTYYVTGFKQRPTCWSQQLFVNELAFWELTQVFLSQPESRQPSGQPDPFGGLAMGKLRRKVWNLVQEPESTLAAKLVALCSILAVLVSNISLTLASLPEMQVNSADGSGNMVPHPAFEIIETGCVALFSIEYFTKMIVAPNRKQVFCEPMNLIDLVAILPFYLELLLGVLGVDFGDMGGLEGAILVVRIVRVLRVVRLLKLGRYSTGLQMFARVFKLSLPQLGMVLIVVAIAVMFFSSLVYFTEKGGADTKFTSIPATFWWSLVTISGVGYGDMCPETVAGKLVASLAITFGLLVLSLPITIIVNHFMQVQDEINLQNVKNEN